MNDPRFSKLHTDPRFVRPKADKNKLVVDSRFKEFFDDSDPTASTSKNGKGKKAHKVDKYGRPLETTSTSNELKRYYRMPDATAEEEEEVEEKKKGKKEKKEKKKKIAPVEVDLDESVEEESEVEEEEEDSESSEEEEASEEKTFIDRARGEGGEESSDEERRLNELSDSDSDSEGEVALAPLHLRNRRVASPSRSPSIDLSETEPAFGLDEDDVEGEILSEEDEEEVEPTKRLAVVNMDWDHLRATDLYRVLASSLSATAIAPAPPSKQITKKFDSKGEEIGPYKPPSRLTLAQGRLFNLRIYPSKFGTERMEREMREGPPMEVFMAGISDSEDESRTVLGRKKKSKTSSKKNKRAESSDDEDDEITERDVVREQIEEGGEDYDGEALRKYQLERLRYYYAVATFDSAASAAHVFNEINGTEFERTANMFDLQYIPDETSFEEDPVHDEATEASVSAAGAAYQGIEFVTDALRHSKVKLTWDADDPHRKNKISSFLANANDSKGKGKSKGAKEMNEDDIKAYLASSSEDEDGENPLALGSDSEEEEEEEQDDFFEPVAESSKSSKSKKVKGPTSRRDKLRNLFGLDKAGGSKLKAWDGGKTSKNSEEMQITFAPALTDAKSRLNGDNDERDRDETAIETYKRKDKERKDRKKAERKAKRNGITLAPEGEEGPEFGGQDDGPGGFDDAFFAEDADEAFAAFDAGEDLLSDGEGNRKKKNNKNDSKPKLSKRQKREAKEAEELKNAEAQASLSLLVASDSDDPDRAGKHFDMRAILKAEKNAGKKHGGKGKGKKGDRLVGDDTFEIDVKDDRFKSLHEDFDFAIDPTDTRFQKTKNTAILLAEGRKRREKHHDTRAPVGAPSSKPKVIREVDESESLRKLVESVKRKAGDVGGRGKRSKVES